MNQATVIVGAILAGFVFWLAANGRLPAYLSIMGI